MIGANLVHPSLRRSLDVEEVLWVVHEGHCEEVRLDQFFGVFISFVILELQAIALADQPVYEWDQKAV